MNEEMTDYDAFPNAPGLSADLGLQRRKDGDVPPLYDERGWRWHSICSAHRGPHEGCPRCAVGSYAPDTQKRRPRTLPHPSSSEESR